MSEQINNELILEEIRKSRQDVKATIQAVETRICLKIEESNHRLNILEKENRKLKEELEKVQRKAKENNIVIFGLEQTPSRISSEHIYSEIKRLIDVDIVETDINNLYPLGKEENCPVKIELVSYMKKAGVLKNANKLKGTNIFIANDMTIKQREEHKLLRKHLQLAKHNKNNKCYIKQNKLFVNDQMYTVEELEYYKDTEEEQNKPNSAPGTPTRDNIDLKGLSKKLEKPRTKAQNQQPTTTLTTTSQGNALAKEGKEPKQVKEVVNNEKIRTRSTNTR